MFFHPSSILFFLFLLASIIMMICMNSWFLIWFFIEMNLLCFIPLILLKKSKYSVESSLKYFFVQVLGSILILLGILFMYMNLNLYDYLFISGLSIKLALAPFHQWMINIVEGLDWFLVGLLFTLQKVGPFILLNYIYMMKESMNYVFYFLALLCALIGSLGGLFTSSLRKIMAFSSVAHSGWLLLSLMLSIYMWLMYFIFYAFILFSILILFNQYTVNNLNHIFLKLNSLISLGMGLSLLSMGGMPPFTGFIPKFIVMKEFMSYCNFFIFFVLLFSVIISLFFYARIFIFNFIFLNNKSVFLLNKNITLPLSLFINLVGLVFIPFLTYLS
uniref:NADH-ubiquinone oxidoreductase chain 2 n=1 Tax=Metacrangonyx samanensis TaxID=1199140 RepID=K7ZVU7_9CRUS|nr:NADH dehydrogenase subunit 2 [Metacrangonyx samanensis]